jgi:hypothetical protein
MAYPYDIARQAEQSVGWQVYCKVWRLSITPSRPLPKIGYESCSVSN